MRETGKSGLEAYLKKRVKDLKGYHRKLSFPGHNGAPDQLVRLRKWRRAKLVEVKKPNGRLEAHQIREHERLIRDFKFEICVVYTKTDVEDLLA